MDISKTQFMQDAQALQSELETWRRDLHQHPETGFDLVYTKAFVKQKLEEMGYEPQECGKCGLVVLAGKPGKKTILIRGDMDALPIQEQADIPYKSLNDGKMHACGHDMHTAMMLGAAKLLKKYEGQLAGQVKLMFQPAEEIMAGSQDMINAGVLDGVDVAVMFHVMTGNQISKGFIMIPEGGTGSASSDFFHITVKGKGGHGAMPQLSVDPITAAAHIHLALQEIHAREITPGDFLVITPGIFHAGTAANVIPDTAEMEGTIRTGDMEMVAFAKKRITEIAEATAKAFRTEVEVTYSKSCPPMIADDALSVATRKYLNEIVPEHVLPPMTTGSKIGGGSEDFAFVSVKVPTIGLFLSTGGISDGCEYPQHHPKAVFDDSVLYLGTASYVYIALRWLEDNN